MLFPRSFGSFLFPLLATMHAGQGAGDLDPQTSSNGAGAGAKGVGAHGNGRAVRSPDARLELVVRSYGRAMRELAGMPDPEGHALLQAALRGGPRFYRHEPPTATATARGREREGTQKDERGADYVGNDDGKERRYQNVNDGRAESGLETGRVGSDLTALMERTRWALWRRKA